MLDPATLYHMIPQVGSSTVGLVQREGHCGRVTAGGSLWEGSAVNGENANHWIWHRVAFPVQID